MKTRASAAAVLFMLSWISCAATLEARTWTDRNGRSIDAELVRVFGPHAVLKLRNGKVAKVPLTTLSDADLEFIRTEQEKDGLRVWTDIDGRQVQAKMLRLDGENIFLQTESGSSPVAFAKLSIADRIYVREELASKDQASKLPPPTAEEELPEAREWRDVDGVSLVAQFDRAIPGKVLLAANGITRVVRIDKLTANDHDYLREHLQPKGLAHLVPPKPKPVEVAATTPAPPIAPVVPPVVLPPRPVTNSSPNRAPRSYTPPQRNYDSSYGSTPYTHEPTRRMAMQEVYVCSACKREVRGSVRAGDRCPHCRVVWNYKENEDGSYTNTRGNKVSPWVTWGGSGGGIVAIVVLVLRVMLVYGHFRRN